MLEQVFYHHFQNKKNLNSMYIFFYFGYKYNKNKKHYPSDTSHLNNAFNMPFLLQTNYSSVKYTFPVAACH